MGGRCDELADSHPSAPGAAPAGIRAFAGLLGIAKPTPQRWEEIGPRAMRELGLRGGATFKTRRAP